MRKIILVTVLMLLLSGINVYAENVPTTFIIEVENTVTGERPNETETFNFQIESDTSPLPDKTEIEIVGTDLASFDEIVYTAPGVYEYTISQIAGNDENYTYCDTIYNLTVYVMTDDDGVLSVAMTTAENYETSKKVSNILFENLYDDPSSIIVPQTGDSNNNILWIALASVSLFGIITIKVKKSKV